MQENTPQLIGVPLKREEVSKILSECFSRDLIDLDEYEKRIEQVHLCRTIDELDSLVSDVPDNVLEKINRETALAMPGNNRITVKSGIERIKGTRLCAKEQEVTVRGSVVRLDFRNLENLPPVVNMSLHSEGSQVRIIVPPNVLAEDTFENSASIIKNRRPRKYNSWPVSTKLIINGSAKGSVIRIKTRKNRKNRH